MSDEDLCRRLAAACGWEATGKWASIAEKIWVEHPTGLLVFGLDLNCISLCEAVVAERGLLDLYAIELQKVFLEKPAKTWIMSRCIVAPARIRAEACLRVLEAGR